LNTLQSNGLREQSKISLGINQKGDFKGIIRRGTLQNIASKPNTHLFAPFGRYHSGNAVIDTDAEAARRLQRNLSGNHANPGIARSCAVSQPS
jgi:hypothetical protein